MVLARLTKARLSKRVSPREPDMTRTASDRRRAVLTRRGFALEYLTLGWNIAGIVVLAIAAITARSVALAGFGLDSLIENRRVNRGDLGAVGRGTGASAPRPATDWMRLRCACRIPAGPVDAGARRRVPPATFTAGHRLDSGHRRSHVCPRGWQSRNRPGPRRSGASPGGARHHDRRHSVPRRAAQIKTLRVLASQGPI